jgi:hypothetical protein
MRYNVMEVSVRLIRKMIETGDTLPLDGAHGRDSDDGSGEDAGDFHGCGEGKGGGGDQSCDNDVYLLTMVALGSSYDNISF